MEKRENPTLEDRIHEAKEKVMRCRIPYEEAMEELKILLDQRNQDKEKNLLEAVASSKWSYEEIMRFIQSDPNDEDEW